MHSFPAFVKIKPLIPYSFEINACVTLFKTALHMVGLKIAQILKTCISDGSVPGTDRLKDMSSNTGIQEDSRVETSGHFDVSTTVLTSFYTHLSASMPTERVDCGFLERTVHVYSLIIIKLKE